MDKKVEKSEKKDKKLSEKQENLKILSMVVLIGCTIVALVLLCFGAAKIYDMKKRVGTKPVEELSADIESLNAEYEKVEEEKAKEQEENGFSEKYRELNKKSSEIHQEISKATGSRHSLETGVDNPDSLQKILQLVPQIWIGALVFVAGLVGFAVLKAKR